MASREFNLDESIYEKSLKAMGLLSPLFSESDIPYFDSRFAENLFVKATNGKNIARKDSVFDALVGENQEIGVGVKTFVCNSTASYKYEKVQEFTKLASTGKLRRASDQKLIEIVASERNLRIETDSAANGIDFSRSIYHCLVRKKGLVFVHEESYDLINLDQIRVNRKNARAAKSDSLSPSVNFTDGKNSYRYSRAKNVLFKKFELDKGENWPNVQISFVEDVFGYLLDLSSSKTTKIIYVQNLRSEESKVEVPGHDYIVLPLYSVKDDQKVVHEKSGLNQWNAGGRDRKFGEAYIRVPKEIHILCPDFFPKSKVMNLKVPGNKALVESSLCQQGDKALMSKSNPELCKWIFKVIDRTFNESDYGQSPKRGPYTYEDLERAGYDSVRITPLNETRSTFEVEFAEIGSYEEFIEEVSPQGD